MTVGEDVGEGGAADGVDGPGPALALQRFAGLAEGAAIDEFDGTEPAQVVPELIDAAG